MSRAMAPGDDGCTGFAAEGNGLDQAGTMGQEIGMDDQRQGVRARTSRWLVIVLAVAVAGCRSEASSPEGAVLPTPAPGPAAAAWPESGVVAPDSDSVVLAPDQLYRRLAPAMAFVETPLGTGSGVLVAPGQVVTNAHVVWPYASARVVFPDGSEDELVPVAAMDTMADLAVLDIGAVGLAPVDVSPVTVADGTQLPIGSDLYLIGYPAEAEAYPQPALTRGILSRVRWWETLDVAFLQTDADIAGGQSGGALVAADGTVVGFSSMFLGDSDLALAMSAPEAMGRVAALLAGGLADSPAPRPIALEGGESRQRVTLARAWDEAVFVLNPPYGGVVDLSAESREDVLLTVLGPYGDVELDADEGRRGAESGQVEIWDHGPYFVVVELDRPGPVTVTSSAPLVSLRDPDDGTTLESGQTVTAVMDFPGDIDAFLVRLQAGEAVTVVVDTVNLVPEVTVEPGDVTGLQPIVDSWLAGPLGLTLTATMTVDESGDYVMYVRDADGAGTGGYRVRLD